MRLLIVKRSNEQQNKQLLKRPDRVNERPLTGWRTLCRQPITEVDQHYRERRKKKNCTDWSGLCWVLIGTQKWAKRCKPLLNLNQAALYDPDFVLIWFWLTFGTLGRSRVCQHSTAIGPNFIIFCSTWPLNVTCLKWRLESVTACTRSHYHNQQEEMWSDFPCLLFVFIV